MANGRLPVGQIMLYSVRPPSAYSGEASEAYTTISVTSDGTDAPRESSSGHDLLQNLSWVVKDAYIELGTCLSHKALKAWTTSLT